MPPSGGNEFAFEGRPFVRDLLLFRGHGLLERLFENEFGRREMNVGTKGEHQSVQFRFCRFWQNRTTSNKIRNRTDSVRSIHQQHDKIKSHSSN